ncbi:MAG: NAD(P) transhydrogenase subunit alpha [Sediminibacterium sp.]|jgi:H+-translocating NAD(P) transhydrogenase subunit alpha|nr:NAD(P) transhydrogenase subunit alpha [Chitinophagaceae bacterium]MCA6446475.1 NAD(P) transhydrogenase subunit alpha [Chitinophagaceae bacterium]
MIIGILKEIAGEKRVAMLPDQAGILAKSGVEVWVEAGAGAASFATDEQYQAKGIKVTTSADIFSNATVLLSFNPLPETAYTAVRSNTVLVGVYQPLFNISLAQQIAHRGLSLFSLDMIPRTTRAQVMDVLSSQANIAGYKAVLKAADLLPHYFPMFMTAAGSIAPAKVLVLGAGVAGLQAIATAKRLGAVVEVSDTRPAVKEEVMSLGAKFIEVEGAADASKAGGYAVEQSEEFKQKQLARLSESVAKSDVIIATAQLQGKKAPVLITDAMLQLMKPGSVVIDLAASTGGNIEGTVNNDIVVKHGITIVGNSSLAADMPADASKVYGKNIFNFLQLIIDKNGELVLNFEDELVKGCCITHAGEIVHGRIKELIK